jgi:prepilin-type processing-associated H-X9-DG protein
LLEVLVVISIMTLLSGLVMAAVAKARSTAARLQCANNLKQIALALHQFHDVRGSLPPGTEADHPKNSQPYTTWLRKLLPFVERSAQSEEIDRAFARDRSFLNLEVHVGRRTGIPLFVCPLDPRGLVSSNPRLLPNGIGFTAYLGVEGQDQRQKDGVLFYDSKTRFGDVSDGLSNTLMVGERPPSATERFGWWYAGWGMNREGTLDATLGSNCFNMDVLGCPRSMPFTAGSLRNECDALHFWSLHPGGAHFALCDGSVRLLTYGGESNLTALATAHAGD